MKKDDFDFLPFLTLANALNGGGKKNVVPLDDLQDFEKGATHIPFQVTEARRKGLRVVYFSDRKEWQMPNGSIVK